MQGEPLFKVKWEGYDAESDLTWEPESNLKYDTSALRYFAPELLTWTLQWSCRDSQGIS